ncbi:glycoside hydrolase family 15 protein [Janibacter sp. GXQ6167]|uniref:glycoside hydrolase family 15 protein n=1 Tax=Janibacter sp. GXQ6167 TaxID=3240791 RepID=UPI003523CB91
MQAPVGDYALLSDRQTAALIAHGQVAWWCVPRFDSPAVFAALLGDEDNGHWTVAPVDGVERRRGYREGSFVLDTVWDTPGGRAVTTDALVGHRGVAAPERVTLVREVRCESGVIEVASELVMRFDYGRTVPWVRRTADRRGEPVLHAIAGPDSLTLHGPDLTASLQAHRGRHRLTAGQSLAWSLTWQPAHLDPVGALDIPRAIEEMVTDWQAWRAAVPVVGPYAGSVADSLAVLRALTARRTGGIVAAPTTSLPEHIGGERNWDYRYTWLRDSALTIQILASHGHPHVAQHWRDWLLRAIAGDPEDLQIMYGIAGERHLAEHTLSHLAGYQGSAPVRIGNEAYHQYQADVVGEVMMALAALREAGIAEDDFSWQLQLSLLELLERRLDTPDRGIWEVRGEPHWFTHGRVLMWTAFDRGVRAVVDYGLDGPAERWARHRDRLHREIFQRGVRGGTFVQHYDTDAVDAALLQIPQTGFVAADSPVMLATVARIEDELMTKEGFVRRYLTDGSDGIAGGEGVFLMCTFWLAEQHARTGRRDEAIALMDRLLGLRNDLGLLSEEYSPEADVLLGNYPQAFSHLALVRAAEAITASGD